jgi:N-acetylglucosamine-6-phosphate deacetylase
MEGRKIMGVRLDYATVITPTERLTRSSVVIDDAGKIAYIGPMEGAPAVDGLRLDLRNLIVAPGFIDIHVHGGHGITFGSTETLEKDLKEYSSWVVQNGVTGFLLSITAPSPDELAALIRAYVPLFEKRAAGAEPLGIHLEGPFMNIERKGAQNPAWIRDPDIAEADRYLEAGQGWIRQMTMAPELPNAEEVAARFRSAGVVLAVGHSTADYDIAVRALAGNWKHITHTFNAQTGLHHRDPGIVGAVLGSEQITAELIADTIHVHPGAMKVLIRCLGSDRVVLVTDAMAGAGLPDGEYELLGFTVTVHEGKATQADGTIAGSAAVMNECVRNVHQQVKIPLEQAIKMASLNPARVIGLSNRLGSLVVGNDASITVVDEQVNVHLTMVNGEIVYNAL